MKTNSYQCLYCENVYKSGCVRCRERAGIANKSKPYPLEGYLRDVAQGNFRTKKAWEMLPYGWRMLFLLIVMFDENGERI